MCQTIEIISKSQGVTLNILNPSSALNVQELNSISGLTLFPNPVGENLTVTWTDFSNSNLEIRLLDVSGKQLSTQTFQSFSGENKHELNLSNFTQGIYLVELKNLQTGNHETRRVIKK